VPRRRKGKWAQQLLLVARYANVRDCNSARPEKYYMHALSPVIYNKPRAKICCRTRGPFVFISVGAAKKNSGKWILDKNVLSSVKHLGGFPVNNSNFKEWDSGLHNATPTEICK
jgi:hypothetical protein